MFAFTAVEAEWAVLVSSMLISLAGTAMYAVLCKQKTVDLCHGLDGLIIHL